jgi:CelD/BcsL family acetyltransferase involved in cellulose biosynthesis
LAWRTLCQGAGIDVVLAERIRTDARLHQVLRTEKAADTHLALAVSVAWNPLEDWSAYHRRLSWRQTLDRQLRRLQERGHVAFERVQEPSRQHALIAWLWRHKLERLAQQGAVPVWGDDTEYVKDFLTQAARRVTRFGQLVVFALTLDHEPIAVQTWTLDAFRMTVLQIAYDPEWSKYGPGNLLFRHGLHWAFERRLPVDFGLGHFGFKKVFGNGEVEVLTRIFAANGWGHLGTRLRTLERHLKARRSVRREAAPPTPVAAT